MTTNNHVFTCAVCGRQWSIYSNSKLECFFVGLCYYCIRVHGLSFALIATVLRYLVTLMSRNAAKPATVPVGDGKPTALDARG